MKTLLAVCFSIAVVAAGSGTAVLAQEERPPLAEEIETPDLLIRAVDPEKRNEQYGEEDIYISGEGAKQNQLVTPDPLQRTLDSEAVESASPREDIKLKHRNPTEEDKAIETPDRLLKTLKDSVTGNDDESKKEDLVTPDPLMDNVN